MAIIGNKCRNYARVTKKLRRQWYAREKLMILYYAQRVQSKKTAAKRFDIEPKQIRDWEKKREQLMSLAPYIKKLHPGRSSNLPELEKLLFQWLQNLRQESKSCNSQYGCKKSQENGRN